MDRETRIGLASLAIWAVGMFLLNRILVISGSFYPMLDEFTANPRYNPKLNELISYVDFGWTAVCIALGVFWTKAASIKDD
ncbi:MAG: hypothetical protein ACYC77_09255 [Coriobacteriia bacterium]